MAFISIRLSFALLGAIALAGVVARAQEPLTIAKVYYAAAAYDEALKALASARPPASSADATAVVAYRAYCLLALGKTDEARSVVESLVLIDPFFRPAQDQVSPRVRAFFDEVRHPLLDDVAWLAYDSAREAFERNDLTASVTDFEKAVALLDELPVPLDPDVGNLRALAAGFLDLARLRLAAEQAAETESMKEGATAEAGAVAAGPPVASPAPDPEDPNRIYSDEDPSVIKPEVVSRPLPPWVPPPGARGEAFAGVIEIVIGPDGKVESSRILESVYPLYDSLLISAARTWQFRPATRDGAPVRYRYRLAVRMGES